MSRFLDEIAELPGALRRMAEFYRGEGGGFLEQWAARLKGRRVARFTGMGTSEFAPLAIRARMAKTGTAVSVLDSGEWLHFGATTPADDEVVVLLSQSGESFEIVKIIERGLAGNDFIAITNNQQSTLGRSASLVLPLHAGEEASISTKTYSNTLGLLYLMARAVEGQAAVNRALDELDEAADCVLSAKEESIKAAAASLLPATGIAFIGRGASYVAARQSALTFMEGTRLLAGAFTAGAFRHGPFEANGPDFRLVTFLPEGPTRCVTENMAREAARLGSRVVLLTDTDAVEEPNVKVVRMRNVKGEAREELFPLVASAAQALLLHHVAAGRGIEAGHFRFGGKVTLKE